MVITEGKQRFIGEQDNHVQDVEKPSNASNWQDAARTGALTARRKSSIQSQNQRGK